MLIGHATSGPARRLTTLFNSSKGKKWALFKNSLKILERLLRPSQLFFSFFSNGNVELKILTSALIIRPLLSAVQRH